MVIKVEVELSTLVGNSQAKTNDKSLLHMLSHFSDPVYTVNSLAQYTAISVPIAAVCKNQDSRGNKFRTSVKICQINRSTS